MRDLVLIDRSALLDLIKSAEIAVEIIHTRGKTNPITDDESVKIRYANKCVGTLLESYKNNNE